MLYKPGACNIGKNEIKKRYAFGVAGFALTAVLLFLYLYYNVSVGLFILLIIPLFAGFEGFYQGRLHFCAGFGMAGKYDFKGTRNEAGRVKDRKQHRLDVLRSMSIHIYSLYSAETVIVLLLIIHGLLST